MHAIAPVGVANAAPGRRAGGARDGRHLLDREDLGVIRGCMPAGAAEVARRHAGARRFFQVLDGAALPGVDGACDALAAGHGPRVSSGAARRVRNETQADVHVPAVPAPARHGDRVGIGAAGAAP